MLQQTQWLVQDPAMIQQLKPKPPPYINNKVDREETKDELNKQAIFRIDNNLFDLSYQYSDPTYKTHSQLLNHTKIRAQDREKLKSWLLTETQNLYQRETYATASKFLDMFFSKLHKVPRNAFQVLGIACLMLASKVVQRRMPSISFEVFDKNQVFGFERGLLEIFDYKVTPVTYVSMVELLFYFWDNYQCQQHPFKEVKYFKQDLNSLKNARVVFETLDCLDLVPQTLDIPLDNLVVCTFLLQNRKFCLEVYKNASKNHQQLFNQTDKSHEFNDVYEKFMYEFLKCLGSLVPAFSSVKIDNKTILYIMGFSRINPKISLPAKYKNFRFEIARQTYNPQISALAQKAMNKT